jgi:hypothetical protein
VAQFPDVLKSERQYLSRRQSSRADQPAVRKRSSGIALALSGGGIRSAAFSLGALQALAKLGLLRDVDYLSAVSGGAFTAGWLTAWISRSPGAPHVQRLLAAGVSEYDEPNPREAWPLRAFRAFSSYLTPNLDLIGGDPWSLVAAYGINFFSNAVIMYLLIATTLLFPLTLLTGIHRLSSPTIFWGVTSTLLALYVVLLSYGLLVRIDNDSDLPVTSYGLDSFAAITYLSLWIFFCHHYLERPADIPVEWLSRAAVRDILRRPALDAAWVLPALIIAIFSLAYYRSLIALFDTVQRRLPNLRVALRLLFAILTLTAGILIITVFDLRLLRRLSSSEFGPDAVTLTVGPPLGLAICIACFGTILFSLGKRDHTIRAREWVTFLLGRHVAISFIASAIGIVIFLAPWLWAVTPYFEALIIVVIITAFLCIKLYLNLSGERFNSSARLAWSGLALLVPPSLAVCFLVSLSLFNFIVPEHSQPYDQVIKSYIDAPLYAYWTLSFSLLVWLSYRIGNNNS